MNLNRSEPLLVLAMALVAACAKEAPKVAEKKLPEVLVETKDFAFTAPDTIGDGAAVWHLKNLGPTFHHVQLVRLDSGRTTADAMDALKKMESPAWMVDAGGPNAAEPGREVTATIALAPGNYLLLCFVDFPDKVPHLAKGMVRPLTVVARANAAPLPTPATDAISIALNEFAFTAPDTIKAGHHQFSFANAGKQSHEVVVFKFKPGQTLDSLAKWGDSYKGPAPMTGEGGTAAVAPGANGLFDADLTPGNYVLICFIPDPADKKPHMMKGMVKLVTVI
jgi:hypothetical protein